MDLECNFVILDKTVKILLLILWEVTYPAVIIRNTNFMSQTKSHIIKLGGQKLRAVLLPQEYMCKWQTSKSFVLVTVQKNLLHVLIHGAFGMLTVGLVAVRIPLLNGTTGQVTGRA